VKLGLGTAQFGGPYGLGGGGRAMTPEEIRAILERASEAGLDTLDTAIAYGASESRLGEIGVDRWRVVSKIPPVPEGGGPDGWMRQQVEDSLARLRIPKLYGLLLHRPAQLLMPAGDDIFAGLEKLKRQGLAARIGVSIYDPAELDVLLERYPFDIVQAPFNVVDRRLLRSGWLARLRARGTEVHVRSIFLQGLLLMAPDRRPPRFERWRPLWRAWEDWLLHAGLSPLEACLSYALSLDEVDRVLVGVDSPRHMDMILSQRPNPGISPPEELALSDPELIDPSRWSRP
jgi:aryl-alcohol dehydrogenase-like predicted oxidoreductase